MKHYKAPDNSLHVIDPYYVYMLPPGSVEITDEEVMVVRVANTHVVEPPPPVDPVIKLKEFLSANPDVVEILK